MAVGRLTWEPGRLVTPSNVDGGPRHGYSRLVSAGARLVLICVRQAHAHWSSDTFFVTCIYCVGRSALCPSRTIGFLFIIDQTSESYRRYECRFMLSKLRASPGNIQIIM